MASGQGSDNAQESEASRCKRLDRVIAPYSVPESSYASDTVAVELLISLCVSVVARVCRGII